jgi:putative membrane protein
LSSTSSAEPALQTRSATEILASRYRHLFVLPSAPALLIYAGAVSLLLALISRGTAGLFTALLVFFVFVPSGLAVSSAVKIADRETIATFRRTQAVLLGGQVLWLISAGLGAVYSWFSKSQHPLTNAFLFGAFLGAGFEFLVINGTFTKSAPLAFVLAAIHPASTLVVLRLQELAGSLDVPAIAGGMLALVTICAFPLLLKRRKTSLGHDALGLFQAFMKAWAAGDSTELEAVIADHSEETDVTTKILRFRSAKGDAFIVLPGVHPGPFHPIGSYDLPGELSRAFKELGPVMTMHMPGGHERNLVSREETRRYSGELSAFARSITPATGWAVVRGPLREQIGKATVSATAFSGDLISTISFAPLGSDDLETGVEAELADHASGSGFELSVVDAHNSIALRQEKLSTSDPAWTHLFDSTKASKPERFNMAYSHSSELKFGGRSDLTENGIGLLLVQTPATKAALVLADANNAVPNLRAEVAAALGAAGFELIEFCTSDSHNLAARGLTVERGYEALGEATPTESIAKLVVDMAKLAESRLAAAAYGSAHVKNRVKVFGAKALGEFAGITQASSSFAKGYLRLAVVVVAGLFVISILF